MHKVPDYPSGFDTTERCCNAARLPALCVCTCLGAKCICRSLTVYACFACKRPARRYRKVSSASSQSNANTGQGREGFHLGAALPAVAGQVRDIYGISHCDSHSLAHPGNPSMLWHDSSHAAVVEGDNGWIPAHHYANLTVTHLMQVRGSVNPEGSRAALSSKTSLWRVLLTGFRVSSMQAHHRQT